MGGCLPIEQGRHFHFEISCLVTDAFIFVLENPVQSPSGCCECCPSTNLLGQVFDGLISFPQDVLLLPVLAGLQWLSVHQRIHFKLKVQHSSTGSLCTLPRIFQYIYCIPDIVYQAASKSFSSTASYFIHFHIKKKIFYGHGRFF